jgi:glycosyltransferase involved in cell wall biosynthesis
VRRFAQKTLSPHVGGYASPDCNHASRKNSFDRQGGPIHNPAVRVSVVTPSYRSSAWLKLCIASVADQGVQAEHIVQDACSDDGTLDWLPQDARVKAFIEKDQGMYDAVNRGLRRAEGAILAYLNCDEQYLPGTLLAVNRYFEQHPGIDVLFGDVVVVDAQGQYLHHRRVQVPLKYHTWTCHLSTLSCATFFRRRIFFEEGFQFDARLRDVGDGEWMVRMLQRRVKMAVLGQFTSVFTLTGANMSAGPNARREALELRQLAPAWARTLKPLIIAQHRLRRFLGGMYSKRPFTYEIFTSSSPGRRQRHEVTHPKSRAAA